MKQKIRIISLLITIMMLMVACAQPAPAEAPAVPEEATTEAVETVEEAPEVEPVEPLTVKIAAPAGTPTLSAIKMFKDQPSLGENVTTVYESVKSPDLMASKIISGEVDMAIVPSNLAIKLYNKKVDYKYAASSVWGILYIVATEDIQDWADLKGKEVNMIGRGLTPDVVFRKLLVENGLTPDEDVTFNYVNGSTELAQLFISGKASISIMPEPMVSKVMMKKPETKIALDLQKEWADFSGASSYPQAGLLIRGALAESHPEVVATFLKEYEASINWVNAEPALAGEYSEALQTGIPAPVVVKAVPRSNMAYKGATDTKEALEAYYQILFDFSPELVGGKMPDEGFYLQSK